MSSNLFIGFKGKSNTSSILVNSLSSQSCLLTNSFEGLMKDIGIIPMGYEKVYLFGVDKNLHDSFRLEQFAQKDGIQYASVLDLKELVKQFSQHGINAVLSASPTKYLCNAAYSQLIEKFDGNVALIHIPTIKYFDKAWIPGIRLVLC